MKIIVKNRSGQDMSHMGPYLKSFLPYVQKRMGFNRPPTIFFDSDPQNAENVLGKTAYYNPETEEIAVETLILRSQVRQHQGMPKQTPICELWKAKPI